MPIISAIIPTFEYLFMCVPLKESLVLPVVSLEFQRVYSMAKSINQLILCVQGRLA